MSQRDEKGGKNQEICDVKGLPSFFACMKRFFIGNIPKGGNRYDIEYLREWVFTIMSLLLRYPIGVALLYGSYLFLQEGRPEMAVFETATYVLVWIILSIRPLYTRYGKQLLIILMYGFGVAMLLLAGPRGAGLLIILMTSIVSSAMLTRRENNQMMVLSISTLLIISLLTGQGLLDHLPIGEYGSLWYINALTTVLVIGGQYFLWNIIYNGLADQIERYNLVIQGSNDGLWDWDIEADHFYMSDQYKAQLGYLPNEITDGFESSKSLIHPEDRQRASIILQEYLDGKTGHYGQVFRMRHKDGSYRTIDAKGKAIWGPEGKATRIAGSHSDITERILKEERILYLSNHDQLTGLLNIKAFRDRLKEGPSPQGNAILFIDIDNYRLVNEILGSESGDQILQELAGKFQTVGERYGTPYRYEGDEFVLVMDTQEVGIIKECAQKILTALYSPTRMDNRMFLITASIGAAVLESEETLENCIRRADTAMYVAKRKKNNLTFYDESMKSIRTREKVYEEDMFQAIEAGQFVLYFQPVYDIKKVGVHQVEALLRWDHPTFGRIPPGEFIPIAERTKFIIPLTEWVLDEICRQLAAWTNTEFAHIKIAMNLSFLSLENRLDRFIDVVRKITGKHGVNPERVEFEVTETTLMDNSVSIIEQLRKIRELGVHLSLDDFGTGYSSFGYLKDLPLDTIKLDKSLIQHIDTDPREQLIASSICTIIHSLGMMVVAEGVEEESQFLELKKAGADSIQGFLFSKPLSLEDLEAYCRKNAEIGK